MEKIEKFCVTCDLGVRTKENPSCCDKKYAFQDYLKKKINGLWFGPVVFEYSKLVLCSIFVKRYKYIKILWLAAIFLS